jgi:hypothetical protein
MKVSRDGVHLTIHFTKTETEITVPPPKIGGLMGQASSLAAFFATQPQTSVLAMPMKMMAPSMRCTIHDAADVCTTVYDEGPPRIVLEPCTLATASGLSVCRPPDRWNQTKGCKFAMARALTAYPVGVRRVVWQCFLERQPRILSHRAIVKRMLRTAREAHKAGSTMAVLGQELLAVLKQSGRL